MKCVVCLEDINRGVDMFMLCQDCADKGKAELEEELSKHRIKEVSK